MTPIQREALKYDLASLVRLQDKRRENVSLFEDSIRKEREARLQEETAEAALKDKLRLHDMGVGRLPDDERQLIANDLPKLASTRAKRDQTIMLLKAAILEEQEAMDREEQMIRFLEKHHDGPQ